MARALIVAFVLFCRWCAFAQLPVGRDTITVIENNYVLKMPWAGGLNFCELSQIDLDGDSANDIVVFDKTSPNINGVFRCFLNKGTSGKADYTFDPSLSYKLPYSYYWAFFYDYNNDGKADFFTYVVGGIKVYKNVSSPGNLSFQLLKYRLNSDYNPGGTPSYGNIPSSGVGVPGLADIDGDGDMDILVFSTSGVRMEYHKNKSKELYGHADSLVYEFNDGCWGDIEESSCLVELNDCPLKQLYDKAVEASQKVYHAGACIMCFDRDSDGDQDLILGDVSCNKITYLENGGSASNAHITDTTSLYPNYQSSVNPVVNMVTFPCTYYMDVDNDNKKDLIASPNQSGSENYKSVWLYKNTGTTTANFQFVKNNFLQDEMIEVGEGAAPVLFDNDGDGLLDLLIGNSGYFSVNTIKSRMTYYKNTGTLSQPSYSLITRDFAALSTSTISNRTRIIPAFGDIDGDGDQDMILGDGNGDVHWYENTAAPGMPCNFTNFKYDCFNITAACAYPQLIDVNRDGLLDLLIGTLNGRLSFYKNIGTATSPSFSLVTNFFGGVNVNTQPANFLGDGSCAPFMYDAGGSYKLLCGSVNGNIFMYDNIDGNLTGNFNRLDTAVNFIYEGAYSTVQYLDINGDGKRDLLTGNYCGGLNFYSSAKPIGIKEISSDETEVMLFPNPVSESFIVKHNSAGEFSVEIMDLEGRCVLTRISQESVLSVNISPLAKGIYIVKIISGKTRASVYKKVVIE